MTKKIYIFVNAKERELKVDKLSYEDVVFLGLGYGYCDFNIKVTVGYRDGPDKNKEGSLVWGQEVFITDGMIFNASITNNA